MSYLSKQRKYALDEVEKYLRAEPSSMYRTEAGVERIVAKALDKDMSLEYDKSFVRTITREILRTLKEWHPTRGGHAIDHVSHLEWKEDQ